MQTIDEMYPQIIARKFTNSELEEIYATMCYHRSITPDTPIVRLRYEVTFALLLRKSNPTI